MLRHGPVKGQTAAEGVEDKARRPVVPENHGGIVVKGEKQGLLVFGAAQLPQLLPAGEGGEKELARLRLLVQTAGDVMEGRGIR